MSLGSGGGVNNGHFVLSPVSLALRDPHLHLRSHGKIGDCEQSSDSQTFYRTLFAHERGLADWLFRSP